MTITPAQSRAARALLDISQSYVGACTRIGQGRISNFENSDNDFLLSSKALIELEQFYSSRGIELTDQDGVRRKPEFEFKTLHGKEGFRIFMNDVYEFARIKGGKVSIVNGSTDEFIKWLGDDWYADHAARMEKVKDNIDFRIVTGQQSREIARGFATYKTIPGYEFSPQTIYLFGNNIGFFIFTEDALKIFVTNHKEIAGTLHYMFDLMWDKTQ